MPAMTVEESLELDLEDVFDARVRLVGGEIVVTADGGPARLSVQVLQGEAVEVVHELETLRVYHPEGSAQGVWRLVEGLAGGRKPEALVRLNLSPQTQVDLTAVTASVVASGLAERLTVNSVSGDVALKDLTGPVDVKTVSGALDVLGLRGDLRAKTVSGAVTVANGVSVSVDVKTVSGDVSLDVGLAEHGTYDITTVSGDAGLLVPHGAGFSLDATTLSGRLVTDFGLAWSRKPGRRSVSEVVGTGGGRVGVKTLSGTVRLLNKQVAA